MLVRTVSVLLLLILAQLASAQTPEETDELKLAWTTYVEAIEANKVETTIEKAQAVLDIGTRVLPETDERIAVLTQNYGSALLAGKRLDEAREQLEIALELLESRHGKDSIELVTVLGELADASGGASNEHRQMKVYKRALAITADEHGSDSVEYATLALRAARNVYEQSRSQIGKKYMEAAREIFLAEFGEEDLRFGLANFYLGKMRFSKRQYKQATKHLEAALLGFAGDSDKVTSMRLMTRAALVQAYESWGKSELATPHCVAIGQESQHSPNQDYEPIFRIAPRYPRDLLIRGVEGHVDFEFTIDENGIVRDPEVIAMTPVHRRPGSSIRNLGHDEVTSFEGAATDVVTRFRYAPRFVDGEAVAVEGVKIRISFKIND